MLEAGANSGPGHWRSDASPSQLLRHLYRRAVRSTLACCALDTDAEKLVLRYEELGLMQLELARRGSTPLGPPFPPAAPATPPRLEGGVTLAAGAGAGAGTAAAEATAATTAGPGVATAAAGDIECVAPCHPLQQQQQQQQGEAMDIDGAPAGGAGQVAVGGATEAMVHDDLVVVDGATAAEGAAERQQQQEGGQVALCPPQPATQHLQQQLQQQQWWGPDRMQLCRCALALIRAAQAGYQCEWSFHLFVARLLAKARQPLSAFGVPEPDGTPLLGCHGHPLSPLPEAAGLEPRQRRVQGWSGGTGEVFGEAMQLDADGAGVLTEAGNEAGPGVVADASAPDKAGSVRAYQRDGLCTSSSLAWQRDCLASHALAVRLGAKHEGGLLQPLMELHARRLKWLLELGPPSAWRQGTAQAREDGTEAAAAGQQAQARQGGGSGGRGEAGLGEGHAVAVLQLVAEFCFRPETVVALHADRLRAALHSQQQGSQGQQEQGSQAPQQKGTLQAQENGAVMAQLSAAVGHSSAAAAPAALSSLEPHIKPLDAAALWQLLLQDCMAAMRWVAETYRPAGQYHRARYELARALAVLGRWREAAEQLAPLFASPASAAKRGTRSKAFDLCRFLSMAAVEKEGPYQRMVVSGQAPMAGGEGRGGTRGGTRGRGGRSWGGKRGAGRRGPRPQADAEGAATGRQGRGVRGDETGSGVRGPEDVPGSDTGAADVETGEKGSRSREQTGSLQVCVQAPKSAEQV